MKCASSHFSKNRNKAIEMQYVRIPLRFVGFAATFMYCVLRAECEKLREESCSEQAETNGAWCNNNAKDGK